MKAIGPIIAIGLALCAVCLAQSTRPQFEVASVKTNKSTNERPNEEFFPNRYLATNVSLRALIHAAYRIPNPYAYGRHYLVGGSDWLDSERFDVEGKVEDEAIRANESVNDRNDRIRLMLQTLLADRFQLTLHRETREVPVYEMVPAKNGPKLMASTGQRECPGLPVGSTACGGRFNGGMGRGITAKAVDLAELAQYLSAFTDRPILDRTAIPGLFDIKTTPWRPDRTGPNFVAEVHADPEILPTIFSMLQEQLGLRLVAAKAPFEILVIDSVQQPSEN